MADLYMRKIFPKPVGAFQMTEARRDDQTEWPAWLVEASKRAPGDNALFQFGIDLMVDTVVGPYLVKLGDWIIQSEQLDGGMCLLRDSMFQQNYEKVVTCEA